MFNVGNRVIYIGDGIKEPVLHNGDTAIVNKCDVGTVMNDDWGHGYCVVFDRQPYYIYFTTDSLLIVDARQCQ